MKIPWLETIEHLEKFDSVIDRDDIAQLRLYFKLDGLSNFTKSPMGGMLERADMFSPNYQPCTYCGGHISIGDDDEDVGGIGFLVNVAKWNKKIRKSYNGIASNRCDGTQYTIEDGSDCVACGTRGWRQTNRHRAKGELTAQPRKDSGVHRDSVSMNVDVKIGTCAIVSSIIDRADVIFPLATTTLASIYGRNNYGTLGLWHLTPSGKTLLRGNSKNLIPEAYFIEVRTANEEDKKKNVAAQLSLADEQAKWLKEQACRAWNAASFVYRCGV
jgi:hypothetical protein